MLLGGDEIGPNPAGQQQRLLPGQRDLLVRLGRRRRGPARLHPGAGRGPAPPPRSAPPSLRQRRPPRRHRVVHSGRIRHDRLGLERRLDPQRRGLPRRHARRGPGRPRPARSSTTTCCWSSTAGGSRSRSLCRTWALRARGSARWTHSRAGPVADGEAGPERRPWRNAAPATTPARSWWSRARWCCSRSAAPGLTQAGADDPAAIPATTLDAGRFRHNPAMPKQISAGRRRAGSSPSATCSRRRARCPASPESVLAVVDRLGSLQFDPLEVAGRNHDLVLQARIAGYSRELTDELLYGRRLLFEAYNKALNLLPTRELPYYRITWQDGADGRAGELIREQAALAEKVLAEITAEGPKCSGDFEREAAIDWWWGPTSAVRAVLEALARLGQAGPGPTRRQPPLLRPDRAPLPRRSARHAHPRARAAAPQAPVAIPRPRPARRAGGSGELWPGTGGCADRAELRRELVDRGEIVAVMVEGMRGERFVVGDEMPLLAQAEREMAAEARAPLRPRRRRPPAAASWPRSTRSCGTARSWSRCTTSSTAGRSTRRRPSAAGATTSCRSSSVTACRPYRAAHRPPGRGGANPRPGLGVRLRADGGAWVRRRVLGGSQRVSGLRRDRETAGAAGTRQSIPLPCPGTRSARGSPPGRISIATDPNGGGPHRRRRIPFERPARVQDGGSPLPDRSIPRYSKTEKTPRLAPPSLPLTTAGRRAGAPGVVRASASRQRGRKVVDH